MTNQNYPTSNAIIFDPIISHTTTVIDVRTGTYRQLFHKAPALGHYIIGNNII